MELIINDPVVVAELTALHEAYETALVSNDADQLIAFFWDSAHALRFGISESLYGAEEIARFRRNRPPIDLDRTAWNVRVVTFGSDCGIVTLEFLRKISDLERHGRQTQVWRKFANGWKIVSAHVSFVPSSYLEHAAAMVRLPIPEPYQEGVRINIERSAVIARPLLEASLDELTESAPVFQP